jgi:hypothetical protein
MEPTSQQNVAHNQFCKFFLLTNFLKHKNEKKELRVLSFSSFLNYTNQLT